MRSDSHPHSPGRRLPQNSLRTQRPHRHRPRNGHCVRLDVAVNNGGTEGQPGPLTEQTADTYAATFDTNVLGVVLSLKHELRVMNAQKRGSIINVSSVVGHFGIAGASLYVASKHAVEGLTKSAALEGAATGVRVNAVAPGPIETPMFNRFVGDNATRLESTAVAWPPEPGHHRPHVKPGALHCTPGSRG